MAVLSAGIVQFEDLRSLAFGSITSSYVAVGTAIPNAIRLLNIDNSTDQNVIISFNGVNDKIFLAANSGKIYDFGTNRADRASVLEQSAYTTVYVKAESDLPSLGSVHVMATYASEV